MPWYNDLRPQIDHNRKEYSLVFPQLTNEDRERIIPKVLRLRKDLDQKIPTKNADESLLLASWNIKEFGHLNERLPESYFYIAEIMNKFDLIAVQEIKSSLTDLNIILRILGKNYGYIITDITEGNDGNRERFGYIFDKRKVKPSGLSGEMVLWDSLTKDSSIKQLKRTPAITGFNSGWKSFIIINTHLHPGSDSDDHQKRKEETTLLMRAISEKFKKKHLWSENIILLGDMNLYSKDVEIIDLLNQHDFIESYSLKNKYTNVSNNEIFDRMFFRTNPYFKLENRHGSQNGNVLNVFESVYTENDIEDYREIMEKHKDNPETLVEDEDYEKYYHRYWKRNQMSDHHLIWVELPINSSDDFLNEKLNQFKE